MNAALSLQDLRKSFGPVQIIRGVSLDIAPGERHAIIGPNGAGKSTLFNLVSGRIRPSSGEVRLQGERSGGLSPYEINRRGLSRSFQITNIFPKTVGRGEICAAPRSGRSATDMRSGPPSTGCATFANAPNG